MGHIVGRYLGSLQKRDTNKKRARSEVFQHDDEAGSSNKCFVHPPRIEGVVTALEAVALVLSMKPCKALLGKLKPSICQQRPGL